MEDGAKSTIAGIFPIPFMYLSEEAELTGAPKKTDEGLKEMA